MRSKAVLTMVTVLAVTFLGACGENKSKKASFRPRGQTKIVSADAGEKCPQKIDQGGRGTDPDKCEAWKAITAALSTEKQGCRFGIAIRMEALKCQAADIEKVRKGTEPAKVVGESKDTGSGRTDALITTDGTTPKTAEEIAANPNVQVVTTVLDPETGNERVEPPVPLSQANIPAENIAPVAPAADATTGDAPAASSTIPESTSVPSATAGTTAVLTGIPSTCSAEQITAAKADTTSCGKFDRINKKAINFAGSLDFRSDVNRIPSRWSTFVCVQSEHAKPAARMLLSQIRKEIPTATDTAKCSSGLTTVTIACARAIKCGGKRDIMALPRLATDPNGPDSDEVAEEAAPAAAPVAATTAPAVK